MYNKLFASILDSSIWLENNPTRIVWFTLLAAMDEDGFARFASIRNLAGRARVSDDEAREAISILEAPDLDSSDPDNDGRRAERVPGGWMVLNAPKYRELATKLISREKTRQRVANFRRNHECNADVTLGNDVKQNVTHASASAYASDPVSDLSLQGDARGGEVGIDQLSGPDLVESLPVEAAFELCQPVQQKRARNRDPAVPLAEDWQPPAKCLEALCAKYGCTPDVVLVHLPDFKLYWIHEEGAGTLKRPVAWSSTFRNRIDQLAGWGRLHVPQQGKGKGNSKYGPPQPSDTSNDGWLARTMRDQRTQG
jgi:hypothetical protein